MQVKKARKGLNKNRKLMTCGQPNELETKSINRFTAELCPHNMFNYD